LIGRVFCVDCFSADKFCFKNLRSSAADFFLFIKQPWFAGNLKSLLIKLFIGALFVAGQSPGKGKRKHSPINNESIIITSTTAPNLFVHLIKKLS